MDVSDRRMQVQLTQEAKIISDFYSIRAIFAFVGFVNGLGMTRCVRVIPFVFMPPAKASPVTLFPDASFPAHR